MSMVFGRKCRTVKCYKGKGCSVCSNSGYKGRIAFYEIMVVNEEIRKLILEGDRRLNLKRLL